MLYEIRYELLQPLEILFNACLKLGKFPKDWKSANIVAIHKKGNKNDVSNYRPASLTCIICKIMDVTNFKPSPYRINNLE